MSDGDHCPTPYGRDPNLCNPYGSVVYTGTYFTRFSPLERSSHGPGTTNTEKEDHTPLIGVQMRSPPPEAKRHNLDGVVQMSSAHTGSEQTYALFVEW